MENTRHLKKKNSPSSLRRKRIFDSIWSNALVIFLVLIWMIPIMWIVASSFSADKGYASPTFFPTSYTLNNYITLFTETDFPKWLLNTFVIAMFNTVLTTFFTLITAYCLSRFRFKSRKGLINISLVLGMFPGFMSMVAVYFILNMLGLINSYWALLVYYVCGAGLGFFVSKGYFDTIPKDIDEAAKLDGANQFVCFFRIFLPLAKPILIYTALLAFMAPWADYILAGLILTDDSVKTVAVGLYEWMDPTKINTYFGKFAAGSCIVAIPIVGLYISLQKYFIAGISSGAVKG
jgi:arabinogalactan oligomer / maltooligosaccharide transport system permease protein